MVLVDGHVRFVKPQSEEDLKAAREGPNVNPDYRGKTLAEFMDGRHECEDYAFLDVVGMLKSAGFPPLPHVVDRLYLARLVNDLPEKLVLLTIEHPGSTLPTHEEMLRLV